jgi:hypothetical protein
MRLVSRKKHYKIALAAKLRQLKQGKAMETKKNPKKT